jgi:hypothetical protein
MPDTDGGVVGGDAVVLVAVLLLVHETATSPNSTTIAKASRFILLCPTPQAVAWFPPSPTDSSADIGHAPACHHRRQAAQQP